MAAESDEAGVEISLVVQDDELLVAGEPAAVHRNVAELRQVGQSLDTPELTARHQPTSWVLLPASPRSGLRRARPSDCLRNTRSCLSQDSCPGRLATSRVCSAAPAAV